MDLIVFMFISALFGASILAILIILYPALAPGKPKPGAVPRGERGATAAFTCGFCLRSTVERVRSEEELAAEFRENFPHADPHVAVAVCTECCHKLYPDAKFHEEP